MPSNNRNVADPLFHPPAPQPKKMLIAVLCIMIIAAGAIGAIALVQTAPKAQKRPPEKIAPLVTTETVYPKTQNAILEVMGTVVPNQELTLKSRVAGEIVFRHAEFMDGGIVNKGELLIQIDDLDYKLIVTQKLSAVADARYALKLEMGRQDVARREWELLNSNNPATAHDAELALRKPHLEKARSDLEAAQAELEAARLQLARTRIYAPFNAVIRATLVERGSQVAAQEPLATLAGTDAYWIKASVPVDRVNWVDIPNSRQNPGAQARIRHNGGAERQGRVVKLLSDLETEGRMARLIIAVKDPLNLKSARTDRPAMLIGEYVRVRIDGRQIEDAFRIPRTALRNNTHVWVVGPEGQLDIRAVETIWRDNQTVLIKQGLRAGDQVIVSDLAAPVPGMTVRIDEKQSPVEPAANAPPQPANG